MRKHMRILSKLQEKKGGSTLMTMFFCIIVLGIGLFLSDYFRAFTLQENLSDELYRASNLAIKTAMYDSYRIDSVSKYDEDVCYDAFYDYLHDDMNLNSRLEKYADDGELEYRLTINHMELDGDGTRLAIRATIYTPPRYFSQWFTYEFSIRVKSRNMRIDV